MDGWMDGWMDRWMDGWMDRWMDGWMEVTRTILYVLLKYKPQTMINRGPFSVIETQNNFTK